MSSSLNELDKMNRPLSADEYKSVSVDELLSAMRMGRNTMSAIRMGSQTIPVRVLSADEVNSIRNRAKVEAAKHGGDETDENLIIQKLTLEAATTVNGEAVGFINHKLFMKLNIDEISYLYNEVIQFWDTFNPSLEKISPERFRELVEALKKNTISWSDCSMPERKAIFTCFVELIQRPDSATLPPVN